MIKRSILALLLVLVAVLSCAHADDAAPHSLEDLLPGVTLVGDQEPIPASHKEQLDEQFGPRFFPGGFRRRFRFPWVGGFRYGWRYPIGYWNTFGRSIFGPSCLFRREFGGYFYC
ncbi:Thioredoxin, nucleoredoxin [Phytophthora cinnamomi]|uniref:Thioredoxin, nucleoredoxin n=1 Tax=Phytophthora cinnamomi TaxID=4785 RepID=UPI0035594445|nr:Thioredoxin, nucleoredoxin [Phytophthora cinnamomi]KAG6597846.1 Thioredoxin, nucleoredoxin [Phytophthora cinnamomi]